MATFLHASNTFHTSTSNIYGVIEQFHKKLTIDLKFDL